jgi:hypothetical protein
MAYYHLKIYYHYSNFWTKIFGTPLDSNTFGVFFDLSEEEVKEIKKGKEENRPFWVHDTEFEPKQLVSIDVYRTQKSVMEYSAESNMRISEVKSGIINGRIGKNVTKRFFPLSVIDEGAQSKIDDLINAAKFLELDENWFISTCALQLQEVMIEKLAKKREIAFDKENLKRILGREVKVPSDFVPFSEKYKAFSKEIKRLDNIDMPKLPLDFRNTRTEVLHYGYNLAEKIK